jgi:hypothetical protein
VPAEQIMPVGAASAAVVPAAGITPSPASLQRAASPAPSGPPKLTPAVLRERIRSNTRAMKIYGDLWAEIFGDQ